MNKQGSDTGSTPNQGVGQFSAVDAFEVLLNPPKEDNQDDQGEAEAEESTDEVVDEAAEESDEAADENEQAESEESAEEEQTEDEPTPRQFTVRVDGKDEQVSESELIAGYQRQADYTRKTTALANERKTLEQEQQALVQERSEYASLLPKLRQAMEQRMGKEPDWEALRAKDPAMAAVEKQRWDERRAQIEAVEREEQRVAQQQEEDNRKLRETILAEEGRKLLEKLPHWKEKAVAQKEHESIGNMLRELGFGDNELAIYDSRAMQIAWMAMKYREIQAQAPAVKKKIEKAPVAKPGGGAPKPAQSAAQKAHQRLAKSGKVKDAAAFFEQVLS